MSIVEFFFNSDYRESINRSGYSQVESPQEEESNEQKLRRLRKFDRDYHLKQIQHEVDLLHSEILYGFIDVKEISSKKFKRFISNRGAKPWVFKVLWERFIKKYKLVNYEEGN